MVEKDFRVVTAAEVDAVQLDLFLRRYFSEQHCDFLRDYGSWHHKSNKNRIIVLNRSNQIVGYYAVIPSTIWLLNRTMSALFWVDLYVSPEWRGRGIQRLTDKSIIQMPGIKLGFPNELSAAIHRKHGWGVREDHRVMMLPLLPARVVRVLRAKGVKGLVLRFAAQLARPVASVYRHQLERYKPVSAKVLDEPYAKIMAAIFLRYRDGWVTTNRSVDYIRWRYLESPDRSQYDFFVGGASSTASLFAVARTFDREGVKVTRVLDVFGDLDDLRGLSDLLRLVAREAMRRGSSQITALASQQTLLSTLRANGFILGSRSCFCWLSKDPQVTRMIGSSRCHWVLADSDNDLAD